ncbi:MAG TPA: ABC transporter substrate-binding protein [Noviherbaspirillum sp.]|nr:ABC transporter substrate-binding protein [Noviherbaspirillum sp.]
MKRMILLAALLLSHAAPSARAEDGVSDDTILIGQTAALTGQVAGSVREMNEGARAYLEMVNRRGGVHGRRIELRTLDDRFDPQLAAHNAETLVRKEHVFALFLTRGTPHTEAVLPLLAAERVPLIAPSTGAAVFHAPVNRLLFNVRAKYRDEVAKAVEHFATVGIASIGILRVDDAFGADVQAGFDMAMQARRLKPALAASFDRAAPDVAAAVRAVLGAAPQALVIAGSATTTAGLIAALRAQGSRTQVMTLSNNASRSFVERLGADGIGVIVSQVTPAPHLVTSGLGQEFKAAASATGATVSYAAMEGFVAAKVLVEGLRRAGPRLTREGLVRALESMRGVDLGGLMLGYGPDDHTGSEFVELTMIGKGGRFLR